MSLLPDPQLHAPDLLSVNIDSFTVTSIFSCHFLGRSFEQEICCWYCYRNPDLHPGGLQLEGLHSIRIRGSDLFQPAETVRVSWLMSVMAVVRLSLCGHVFQDML